MNTRTLLKDIKDTLPADVYSRIKYYKDVYKNPANDPAGLVKIRCQIYGYTNALHDAGMITETERRMLYSYLTL